MSYDVELVDPVTLKVIELDKPHFIQGAIYAVDGTTELCLNVTSNYSPLFKKFLHPDGLMYLNGETVDTTFVEISRAVLEMKNDIDENYWNPTEGNARAALLNLLTLALGAPGNAIWRISG